ncbi:MAG TPA: TrkA C-terminal domain-containing protein [Longimicrobiales bacterium]|nr:TrkA C-terminal domain-containing protein [Longimicrobiales bacterium]
MIPILSVLLVLAISVLVTKVATVALIHTGMSVEAARFQARSAFTGAGFTTTETEQVVNHPVRRRIIMLLMLVGSAGIVTVIGSLVLGFLYNRAEGPGILSRVGVLAIGLALLWFLASSHWVDRWLSFLIRRALRRWTKLDVTDYASLLRLRGDFSVGELLVSAGDWMQGRMLQELELRSEGVNVLGIERPDGSYVGTPRGKTKLDAGDVLIVYGRAESIVRVDARPDNWLAQHEHERAVQEHRQEVAHEMVEERRRQRATPPDSPSR